MNGVMRGARAVALGSMVGATACGSSGPAVKAGGEAAEVTTAAERGSMTGDAEKFTGEARISMLFGPNGPRDFGAASVAFAPGARTAWHSHPAGQTLVVTEGSGWVAIEGEARREVGVGDVVWTPPGVRHWHGATASTAMTHLALQGAVEGAVVEWAELVDDATYRGSGAAGE